MKLYWDTSVFVSVYKQESYRRNTIPAEVYSRQLLDDVIACRHSIATSAITLDEVAGKYGYLVSSVKDLLAELSKLDKIAVLPYSEEKRLQAFKLDEQLGLGWKDCLHVLEAIPYDCLVSLDNALIAKSKRFVKLARKPEDFSI